MKIQRGPRALENLEGVVPSLAGPSKPVTDVTVFGPETLYTVRLSAPTPYRGTDMPSTVLHTVKGVVAEAIRQNIAAYIEA
jgi:S-ribosylhomocysteine lyase LuxS involved in autoinducer biosynthesis